MITIVGWVKTVSYIMAPAPPKAPEGRDWTWLLFLAALLAPMLILAAGRFASDRAPSEAAVTEPPPVEVLPDPSPTPTQHKEALPPAGAPEDDDPGGSPWAEPVDSGE